MVRILRAEQEFVGEIQEEAFKQMKEMPMCRATEGLGTDLGKTDAFSVLGA